MVHVKLRILHYAGYCRKDVPMDFVCDSFDKLTGLPDLDGFQNAILKLSPDKLVNEKASLLFFNIENFKLYNSTLGPKAGDEMLVFTAMSIQNTFPGELVSRIGEDHFAVLTTVTDVTDRIRSIHEQVLSYHPTLSMLVKAGIYEIRDYETSPLLMLDEARLACENCKGHFDQIYDYYNPSLSESLLTNKYIVDHIGQAIEMHYIKVYYQPLIRIQTNMLCGLEALARWEDPMYGLLSPAAFITVLENAHLIHTLDLYIAEQVCQDLHGVMESGRTIVPVSINLSRLDFDLCDVFETIDAMVRRYGLKPEYLDIEITESALSKAGDSLKNAAQRFREHGYRIWLDDFGSEFSSLNTLKDFDFDVLKIDMAFLSGLPDPLRSLKTKTIVRSVINMAKDLGITTLCEGVETEEQLRFLMDAGCEIAQGYYFDRPLPREEIKNLPYPRENQEDARYSSIIGQVNLLSTHPLGEENLSEIDAGFQPMGLFEYTEDHIRTLVINTAFQDFIAPLQINDLKVLDANLNNKNNRLVERMRRAADKAIETHSTEPVDLVLNGDYCNLQMRAIATNANTHTSVIFVRAMNISRISNFVAGGIKDKALRSVYALFERVDILDLENDRLLNIHKSRGRFRGNYANLPLKKAVEEFAELNIHPDDQERFRKLYDPEILSKLLQKSNHSFHGSLFRIYEGDETYEWQLCMLSLVRIDGRPVILSMLTDGDGIAETIQEQAENLDLHFDSEKTLTSEKHGDPTETVYSKSALFDALVEGVPFGVFWKDRNRRFLGANKFFLDFYGFPSTTSIIGNTDEDMGWHVDPVPFMKDEQDVLNGNPIYDAAGSCIVHGIDHKIVASKFPVWKNGRIIGLIGMFRDKGANIENSDNGIDELTGLLNSNGAIETFNRYQQSYIEKGIDFSIISIDINHFREFNHLYGSQIADELLIQIAKILSSIMGDNSVVSRIGGDEFVILRQVADRSQLLHDEYAIASAISTIHTIQGIPITVNISTESVLYSESPSAALRKP